MGRHKGKRHCYALQDSWSLAGYPELTRPYSLEATGLLDKRRMTYTYSKKWQWYHVQVYNCIARGGDGKPHELFQILDGDAVKVWHSIRQKIWKIQQWPWDWKRSVFTPIPKKGNAKECSNYRTIALISNASKVMLKILQARLQQYLCWY